MPSSPSGHQRLAKSRGYAANDLGSFLAHAEELCVDPALRNTFIQRYNEHAPRAVDDELITIAYAAAVFERAMVPFRTLHPEWPRLVVSRVERCEALLQEVLR